MSSTALDRYEEGYDDEEELDEEGYEQEDEEEGYEQEDVDGSYAPVEVAPAQLPTTQENPLGSLFGFIAGGVVGALAVGVVWWWKSATATTGSTGPTSQAMTLAAGSTAIHTTPGSYVALTLPAGARWLSLKVDGSLILISDPSAPITVQANMVQGTITATWVDGNLTTQSTSIAYGP